MEKEWFYLKDGIEKGPVARQDLRKLAEEDKISLGTAIKRGKDGKWLVASDMAWIFPSVSFWESKKNIAVGNMKTAILSVLSNSREQQKIPDSTDADKMISDIKGLSESFNVVKEEIGKVIVGQTAVIDQVMVAILSGGHCLILGVPGLAKTLLVRCLGEVMDLEFNRIQFTPDLMPSDITGTEVLDEEIGSGKRSLRFVKGPIFTNILLADEINRTPPKTQAALLEAMQERHVTSGGMRFDIPAPFFVLATQNPIEQEGTYPLPEAQLDRFMFLIRMDYPERKDEIRIISQTTANRDVKLNRVISGSRIIEIQKMIRDIPVSDHVLSYATDIVRMSRPVYAESPEFIRKNLTYGAGPRAGQYLILAAKAWAGLNGRVNVCCEDVRRSVPSVLFHRIACNFHAAGEGIGPTDIINKLIKEVPEPAG